MKPIAVGVAALNQTPAAFRENRANILAAIEAARAAGVELLGLPELCITGYGCEDLFHAAPIIDRSFEELLEIAPHTKGMIVSLGLPVLHRGGIYNAACLLADGKIAGFGAKRFLAGDGIYYEPRWFKPWPAGKRSFLDHASGRYPIGDLHFDVGGLRIGFEICEDAWAAARPGGNLSQHAIDVLINPSASAFSFAQQGIRRRFVLEGSRAFGVAYLYANLLGNEAGRILYDGSLLIASGGQMLAEGRRFSFGPWSLATASIDVAANRMRRARTVSFVPEVADAPSCVAVPFELAHSPLAKRFPEADAWEHGEHAKEESFARAVALGLFDYLRKSGAQGYVVSLSGGADSATVSLLVALGLELAAKELGLEGAKARLGHVRALADAKSVREGVAKLLATIYQSTANSGPITRRAAAEIAAAVGAEHHEVDVDAFVRGYVTAIEQAIGRKLTWEKDDVTLQNVQARARGPSAWLLANTKNAVLLATSNRSEAAVGYATMDGDTCGGLSPLAGIDKAFIRRFLHVLEKDGLEGVAPIAALSFINAQAPTAELRPAAAAQTDEKDLMPYEVLDVAERLAIGQKQAPGDVLAALVERFPMYREDELRLWVVRFYELFAKNQWKRERYAPSFHVDDENLDPKTWLRYPILSRAFEAELAALKKPRN